MSNTVTPGQQPERKPRQNSAFGRLMSVHWWMARLYVVLFVGGWWMVQLPKELPLRRTAYDFHKSIGILTIAMLSWRILVLLQVWWRKYTKRFPKLTFGWWRTVILHGLLYLFMWAVPVSGVFLSNSVRPNNVRFFGLVLPDLWLPNKSNVDLGRGLHFWFAYIFLVFIALHLIAQWKVVRAHGRQLQQWWKKRFARS